MRTKKTLSQCKMGFHYWVQQDVEQNMIVSKCSICKNKLISDPSDNEQWRKDHKRDYLQRGDRYYKWIYGDNKPFVKKKDPAWKKSKSPLAKIFG